MLIEAVESGARRGFCLPGTKLIVTWRVGITNFLVALIYPGAEAGSKALVQFRGTSLIEARIYPGTKAIWQAVERIRVPRIAVSCLEGSKRQKP
jgi:hypothetical protein